MKKLLFALCACAITTIATPSLAQFNPANVSNAATQQTKNKMKKHEKTMKKHEKEKLKKKHHKLQKQGGNAAQGALDSLQ